MFSQTPSSQCEFKAVQAAFKKWRGQTFALSLVMEFPIDQMIQSVFSSVAYARILPNRDKGFAFMNIVLCEDL